MKELGSVESQGLPSEVQGSETQLGIVPKPVSIFGIFYSDTFQPLKDWKKETGSFPTS